MGPLSEHVIILFASQTTLSNSYICLLIFYYYFFITAVSGFKLANPPPTEVVPGVTLLGNYYSYY